MNHKNNIKDVWAEIAYYSNIITIISIISFLVFAAVVSKIEFEVIALSSRDNWENIFEKIITLLFIAFTFSLGFLWLFSWRYLADNWDNRNASLNKRLILLMIFIPLVGAYLLYFEHRRSIKLRCLKSKGVKNN